MGVLPLGHGAGGAGVQDQTLNTNISPRSMATVSKSPSQMSGPYWSGRSVARGWAGGPGFGGLSGFPPGGGGWGGRGGRWSGRRGVTVGRSRVGWGWPSGVPAAKGRKQEVRAAPAPAGRSFSSPESWDGGGRAAAGHPGEGPACPQQTLPHAHHHPQGDLESLHTVPSWTSPLGLGHCTPRLPALASPWATCLRVPTLGSRTPAEARAQLRHQRP